ncbi:MAG: hypothetical protein FJX65_16265 [Alphaproteobacteria bacterium]|nr:hypothetical protein [Alphaproteobacteria bacterium]
MGVLGFRRHPTVRSPLGIEFFERAAKRGRDFQVQRRVSVEPPQELEVCRSTRLQARPQERVLISPNGRQRLIELVRRRTPIHDDACERFSVGVGQIGLRARPGARLLDRIEHALGRADCRDRLAEVGDRPFMSGISVLGIDSGPIRIGLADERQTEPPLALRPGEWCVFP